MVVVLLSFIVLALMAVFNSTQAAFRASVTQTDVLESGRAVMEMISDDLRAMTPAMDSSNLNTQVSTGEFLRRDKLLRQSAADPAAGRQQ